AFRCGNGNSSIGIGSARRAALRISLTRSRIPSAASVSAASSKLSRGRSTIFSHLPHAVEPRLRVDISEHGGVRPQCAELILFDRFNHPPSSLSISRGAFLRSRRSTSSALPLTVSRAKSNASANDRTSENKLTSASICFGNKFATMRTNCAGSSVAQRSSACLPNVCHVSRKSSRNCVVKRLRLPTLRPPPLFPVKKRPLAGSRADEATAATPLCVECPVMPSAMPQNIFSSVTDSNGPSMRAEEISAQSILLDTPMWITSGSPYRSDRVACIVHLHER